MFSDQKKLSWSGYKKETEVLELEEDKGNKHKKTNRKCLIKLSNLPSKTHYFFFLLFYENKQNLRRNIFPKQVKLKKKGQREKEFYKKSFQYLHSARKENFTLFTNMVILDENLNYWKRRRISVGQQ